MATLTELDLREDVIDVRDIIARLEELEDMRDAHESIEDQASEFYAMDWPAMFPDEAEELALLTRIMANLEGMGGDEQWRGDWYPVTLIRDSYFQDYAQDLAEELDLIKADARWPYTCIDWERAADELRMDYSSVDLDGITYWTR